MTKRRQRILRKTLAILSLFLIFFVGHETYGLTLHNKSYFSGWTLAGLIGILTAYSIRKKISVLPIGAATSWLQFHVYLGLLSGLVFAIHVDWGIPTGWFEILLGAMFSSLFLSGVVGYYLDRHLPPLLTRRGEEVIFERIPGFMSELRRSAEDISIKCATETGSSTLSEHYIEHLAPFFSQPNKLLSHLRGSNRGFANTLRELDNMDRYLNDAERKFASQLRELATKKDDLDYQYALQITLKGWLLFHVPLAYSTVLLTLLHVVLAYAFGGGI